MKYSVITLAWVLAVASAQFQYTTIRPSAYKPWALNKNEDSRTAFNSPLTATRRPFIGSQSSYTPRPVFSSTPFPARSVFSASPSVKPELSAQPAPAKPATLEVSAFPARSVFSASPSVKPEWSLQPAPKKPATLEVSAFPARSVFSASPSVKPEWSVQPAPKKPATLEVSAFPARSVLSASPSVKPEWSAQPAPTKPTALEVSAFPARSVLSASPSVKPEWSAQPAPTKPAALEVSAFPARSALPTPSASPATWSVSAPKVSEVLMMPAVRVAPVEPAVVAQVSPVYPAAKFALPVPKYSSDARAAETLKFVNQVNANGAYDYAYETNNGIMMQAQGSPRSFYSGEDAVATVVSQGAFGWTSPEGKDISITYVADENGYRATGSAIPVAPEIPPLIARALEYLAKHANTK